MRSCPALEPLLCALASFCSGLGLFLHRNGPDGRRRRDLFVYYTNQSNLLVCVYYGLLLVTWLLPGGFGRALRAPELQLVMASCIWLTHLVYALILWPVMMKFRRGKRRAFPDAGRLVSNALVHYIAPLLAVAEWLLCADKSGLTALSGLWCVVLPLAYFIYAMLRGRGGRNLENTDSPYPYFFLDAKKLSFWKLARNAALLAAAFAALGCAMGALGGSLQAG